MARALTLARRGLFTTQPNPRVGCVLVRAGRVVGEGWHHEAGGPHAETLALEAAGERARGSTVYVTLEPCSHQGRTGPCAQRLVEAGVARVVTAMRDPNPLVDGAGIRMLEAAGIPVAVGVLEDEAAELNCGFVSRMRHGRPYVRVKVAMSLDARTAMADGESRWITAPPARADGHRLRARAGAILTGIGTVLADDPALTVRLPGSAPPEQPLRVVLDSRLRIPRAARLLAEPGRTLVLCAAAAASGADLGPAAEVVAPGDLDGRVDPAAALRLLAERRVNEVHVEAGATLTGALLGQGLVDEIVLYVAPLLLGDGARGPFHLPFLQRLADAVRLDVVDVRPVGSDLRLTARVAKRA